MIATARLLLLRTAVLCLVYCVDLTVVFTGKKLGLMQTRVAGAKTHGTGGKIARHAEKNISAAKADGIVDWGQLEWS